MTLHPIEKYIWSQEDFEMMGWHDATIWSIASNPEAFEFMLDLDYIFKWVCPAPQETHYKFWVCPVTMVFADAWDVVMDIESQLGSIEVADVSRKHLGRTPNNKFEQYAFHIECQEGDLSLKATGFKMYVRQAPVLLDRQSLTLAQRGGISFGRGLSED